MATLEEMVISYVAAWAQINEEERRALLEKSWADDGIYTDPTGEAVGREELIRHIESFHQQYAEYRILCTSGVDEHHSRFRFTWVFLNAEGQLISEGVDFGEVGSDGRLTRITGFFSSPPPLPSSWPADLAHSNAQTNRNGD